MTELTGGELEHLGAEILGRMGFTCINGLSQVRLRDLVPTGPYSSEEHLEFDYLIPHRSTCLIGEITGRRTPRDVERKYSSFRRHFDIVRRGPSGESVWQKMGVPSEHLGLLREVTDFQGFFISTQLQRFDVALPEVSPIACFYKADWDLLNDYSRCIGTYSKYPFLQVFDMTGEDCRSELVLRKQSHALLRTPNRKIASGDIGLADLFTFEASPYELLPVAKVYRRDMLPDLSSVPGAKYQRPLIESKLADMRKRLLVDQRFVFPNSILVVLSGECQYSHADSALRIPIKHGAISVIDGQHRLFSYADDSVHNRLGDRCSIMVTAIHFVDTDDQAVQRYSARTFIEINTNQTRVRPTHLDAIAYDILGEEYPRALAAQVILQANDRKGSRLYGLFDTNQTSLGIIQATTVVSALKAITHLDRVRGLQRAQRGATALRRQGYENLFDVDSIRELDSAEALIQKGTACLDQYFGRVASVFLNDWPRRGERGPSSLEYAKMIAGFVRLLQQFILEGLDWQSVQRELDTIRANILHLRNMAAYDAPLFDPVHVDIPDAQPSAYDDYRFLHLNRGKDPVSIQAVLAERRRR